MASTADAVANRAQQEGRKVGMIRRLGVGVACAARRFGAAERRNGRSRLRRRGVVAASAFCRPRLAFLHLPQFALRGRSAPLDIWCVPAQERVTLPP